MKKNTMIDTLLNKTFNRSVQKKIHTILNMIVQRQLSEISAYTIREWDIIGLKDHGLNLAYLRLLERHGLLTELKIDKGRFWTGRPRLVYRINGWESE